MHALVSHGQMKGLTSDNMPAEQNKRYLGALVHRVEIAQHGWHCLSSFLVSANLWRPRSHLQRHNFHHHLLLLRHSGIRHEVVGCLLVQVISALEAHCKRSLHHQENCRQACQKMDRHSPQECIQYVVNHHQPGWCTLPSTRLVATCVSPTCTCMH